MPDVVYRGSKQKIEGEDFTLYRHREESITEEQLNSLEERDRQETIVLTESGDQSEQPPEGPPVQAGRFASKESNE